MVTRTFAATGAAVFLAGFLGSAAAAQTALPPDAGLPLSDPDDIAALCGGDPDAGLPHFEANCAACHTLGEGAAHLEGPNLYALYGRTAGTAEGFDYSQALIDAGIGGRVWGRETIRPFLRDPQGDIPGAVHPEIAALSDEELLINLMTYVRVQTTPPPPAPEDVVVPDEVLAMAGDVPYGEFLASECSSCHVTGAASATGVPRIDNLAREEMIRALFQYRVGARPNATMISVAARLNDEEIVALAAYFETLQ